MPRVFDPSYQEKLLQVRCPGCGAQPGERCIALTSGRDAPMDRWYHSARIHELERATGPARTGSTKP